MGKNNRQRRANKKRAKEKRKKLRVKKELEKASQSIGPDLHMMKNPFAGLSDEQRKKVVEGFDASSKETYRKSLKKIMEILHRYDPFIIVSLLSSYGLTVGVGDDGIKTKDSDLKINQSHIEICQSLVLQIPPKKLQRELFGPNITQELWDTLIELMRSHSFIGISDGGDDSDDGKSIRLLRRRMMGNTQMVRNWGYFSQVKIISQELYSHFDSKFELSFGFSVSNIIDLFQIMIDEIELANSSRHKALSELHGITDKEKLVLKYYELIGGESDKAKLFFEDVMFESMSAESLFVMMVSHYDMRLNEIYEFSINNLSKISGFNESVVLAILGEFSYALGDLQSFETEHLYLANPIWLRPLIKQGDGKYFCAIPQMFFSFILPSLDRLVEIINKVELGDRRSNYLEEKVVEIINRRFPSSNTISGMKWKLGDVEYETDLITFIDSYALIVEAKSGKISESALRGAPARLKRHVEEILVAPNIQSRRLKERLEELIKYPEISDDLREQLPVDLNTIHKIIRVSVSLEDFGAIQANVSGLKGTGWLPNEYIPCPTMNIADFETLFDFLEHPVQIIHYLETRQSLEEELGYMGDELDLMGLYIGTLFNFGDNYKDVNFIISGMSSPLDAFYNSKDAGIDIPKPQPKISSLFKKIFLQLEQRATPRWTEIGVILNNFSPDDQAKLARMIIVLKKNVRKNWMVEGHDNILVYVPPKASEYALCYIIYNNKNSSRRNEFIEEASRQGLEADHVKQCLVIAKNMDMDDLEYHFIGLMERSV